MCSSKRDPIPQQFDYLVIGAGISGAAAAYELALSGTVALIEAETAPGYHSTGRSAALYTLNYGGPVVRMISKVCQEFFNNPPSDFCQEPIITPRGGLTVANRESESCLEEILKYSEPGHTVARVSISEAVAMAPLLRPERLAAAVYEEDIKDINVALLHKSYLAGIKRRGGQVICNQRIDRIVRQGRLWQAFSKDCRFDADLIVNAAGAWADEVAVLAGASRIGLVPKRRTGIIIDAPEGIDTSALVSIDFAHSEAYLKPDADRIMASPGDTTPTEPHDVKAEDWDVAVLIDWLEKETTIQVKRRPHSWAGLRSFVADETPVLGFDPKVTNFFWLAGQGGYGIMMAPALGRATAELIQFGRLPQELIDAGVKAEDLAAMRFNQ